MNAIRIGKKIRCARTMKGMSQDDLAEKVGRHRPAISRGSRGRAGTATDRRTDRGSVSRTGHGPVGVLRQQQQGVLRGRISTHFLCLGYERITDILRECIKDARRIHPDIVRILVLAPDHERKLAVVTSTSVLPGTVGDALTGNIDSLPELTEIPFYRVQPPPAGTAYPSELCA